MIEIKMNTPPKENARRWIGAGLFAALAVSLASSVFADQKPNVIVIMADDLGYGDVGCYGAKLENVKTPNIDRLAERGLRFTGGYSSASTCTPTRYSLLTGTYAFRGEGTSIAGPNSPSLIQPGTVTLPELMQKAGYQTAVIGKWHLGLGAPGKGPQWNEDLKPGPLEIGFDYSFLLPTTNDRVPQVYVENHRVLNLDPADPLWVGHRTPGPEHKTGITPPRRASRWIGATAITGPSITASAVSDSTPAGTPRASATRIWRTSGPKSPSSGLPPTRITRSSSIFASHDIHVPRMPHERFHGPVRAWAFRGDAIVQFDWSVGELVRILKEQGLEENTLIVFCSDNGPVLGDGYKDGAKENLGDHQPAGLFSGGKYKIMEGGTRTPFITCWPGTIEPGVSDEVVSTIDLATSLATYLRRRISRIDACLDSIDVMGALLGQARCYGSLVQLIQQDNWGACLGYREGKWKLQRLAKYDRDSSTISDVRFQLYNLNNDPGEKKNVSQQHPEVFERMKAGLQKLLDDGRSRH